MCVFLLFPFVSSNFCRIIDELRSTVASKANKHLIDVICLNKVCIDEHSEVGWWTRLFSMIAIAWTYMVWCKWVVMLLGYSSIGVLIYPTYHWLLALYGWELSKQRQKVAYLYLLSGNSGGRPMGTGPDKWQEKICRVVVYDRISDGKISGNTCLNLW